MMEDNIIIISLKNITDDSYHEVAQYYDLQHHEHKQR